MPDQPQAPPDRVIINCDDADEVAHRGAEAVVGAVERNAGRISIALAGGNTPRALYKILATEYRDRLMWDRIDLYWGDERFVERDHSESNYRMVKESLIDHVPIPPQNIYAVPVDLPTPAAAARAYETTVRQHFPGDRARFDIVLLGMGEDGHTASLFPGIPEVQEQSRWVVPVRSPSKPPPDRITLTMPVFNDANVVLFLISGEGKREVMRDIIDHPDEAKTKYPAAMVKGRRNFWLVDRAARGDGQQ